MSELLNLCRLGVNKRIILEGILQKQHVRIGIRLNYLRLRSSDELVVST